MAEKSFPALVRKVWARKFERDFPPWVKLSAFGVLEAPGGILIVTCEAYLNERLLTSAVGYSICAPEDTYNEQLGETLARNRCAHSLAEKLHRVLDREEKKRAEDDRYALEPTPIGTEALSPSKPPEYVPPMYQPFAAQYCTCPACMRAKELAKEQG